MRINGGLECGANAGYLAEKRFQYYTHVLKAFGIHESPNSAGC